MLLLTGISALGVLVALVVGSLAMLFAGLFVTAVKLLPLLLVALAAAWLWCAIKNRRPRARGLIPVCVRSSVRKWGMDYSFEFYSPGRYFLECGC
ncbi:hypothetical protein SODG_005442 [Sodalis praecaptivus]